MRELPWRVSTEGGKKILLKVGDLLFDFSRRDDTQSSPLNKKVDNQAIKKRDSWRWFGAHPLDCVGRASILFIISLSILVLHGAIYFLASIVNHYQTGEEYVRNKLNVPAVVVVVLLAQGSRDCVTRSKEKNLLVLFWRQSAFHCLQNFQSNIQAPRLVHGHTSLAPSRNKKWTHNLWVPFSDLVL